MQKKIIKSERAYKMLVNRMAKELYDEEKHFGSVVIEVKKYKCVSLIKVVDRGSNLLTFCQIDRARAVVEKYAKKYGNDVISAELATEPYMAKFGTIEERLARPVIEVYIWGDRRGLGLSHPDY